MPMEIQGRGREATPVPWTHTGPCRSPREVQPWQQVWGNKFPAVYLCQTHLGSSKQNSGEHQQLASIYFRKWSQRGVWASLIMNQTAITMTSDNSRSRKQANHRGPICILICICMLGGGRMQRPGNQARVGRDTTRRVGVCERKG